MLKYIVIAFTLKGQDQQEIFKMLDHVKELEPDVVLIHGFLPRRIVMEKQFATDVVDKLDSLFPNQINLFNGQPLRLCMTEVATATRAKVYVLGDIREGVKDEVDLYRMRDLEIINIKFPATTGI
jgi:hypothetical protein